MKYFQMMIFASILTASACNTVVGVNDTKVTFFTAKENCENAGYELLTMSTLPEYNAVMNYFKEIPNIGRWLGIEWNVTIGSYQWFNGRVQGVVNWAVDEPDDDDCVVLAPDDTWFTRPCTDHYSSYICTNESGQVQIRGNESVDYDTSFQRCADVGLRLPVIISGVDKKYYKSLNLVEETWLGLRKYGEEFSWVTGDKLSPTFIWRMESSLPHLHLHVNGDDVPTIHSGTKSEEAQACQTPTVTPAFLGLTNYYYRVSESVQMIDNHLQQFTNIKKTECAVECTKKPNCYQYTKHDSICLLYADGGYTNVTNGVPLWQRHQVQL